MTVLSNQEGRLSNSYVFFQMGLGGRVFRLWVLTIQQKIAVPNIYLVLEADCEAVGDSGVGVTRETASKRYMLEVGLKRLLVYGEWGLVCFIGRSEGMVYCPLDDGEAQGGDVESMREQRIDDSLGVGSYDGVREKDVDSAFWVHSWCSVKLKANVEGQVP